MWIPTLKERSKSLPSRERGLKFGARIRGAVRV